MDNTTNKPTMHRAVIFAIALVLIVTGIFLYRDHQNSKYRRTIANELAVQYKAAENTKKPTGEEATANSQKSNVLNFYKDFLANKQLNKSQSEVLAKYGTANLETQYRSSASPGDSFTCGVSVDSNSNSINVGEPLKSSEGKSIFTVTFRNAKQQVLITPQATLISIGGSYRIESIACLGPV